MLYGVPTGATIGSVPQIESNEAGIVTSFSRWNCGWIAFVVGLPNEFRIAMSPFSWLNAWTCCCGW